MVCLVKTTEIEHYIRISCSVDSRFPQFLYRTEVAEILVCPHAIVFAESIAHVSAFVYNLEILAETVFKTLERSYLVSSLERGAAAADSHHLYCILSDHGYLLYLRGIQRKDIPLVLQKHDTLAAYLTACSLVFVATHRAPRTVAVHSRAESESKHATHLVVKFIFREFPRFDAVEIRIGKPIVVVGVGDTVGQTVGPASELHVETTLHGCLRIMNGTPVGYDGTIPAPFPFENVVHEDGVIACMFATE